MHIVYAVDGTDRELDLEIRDPDASVSCLAEALESPGPDLCIDGRLTSGDTSLKEAGLVVGSVIGLELSTTGTTATAVVVRVIGGLSAGASIPLPVGTAVIGRSPQAAVVIEDGFVSREHCQLQVRPGGRVSITDLGSSNGTELNGQAVSGPAAVGPEDVISIGGAALLRVIPVDTLEPTMFVDPLREVRRDGTILFTRPPRALEPQDDTILSLPSRPDRRAGATFSIAAVAGPTLMAAAVVAISRDLRYAAISALTPLMALANFAEQRTRGRRSLRRGMRKFIDDVDELRSRLSAYRAIEARRRRSALIDPAQALFRSQAPGLRLWERRPGDAGFLRLVVGTADINWTPPIRQPAGGEVAPEVQAVLEEQGRLSCVPVAVDLAGGGVIGLAGDRSASVAISRSLLLQAVVGSGPADLEVAVLTDADRAGDWDWTKWLPHLRERQAGRSGRLVAVGDREVDALARELMASHSEPAGGPHEARPTLLLLVDGDALLDGRACVARELLGSRGSAVAGIVLTRRLPALCTVTLQVAADGTATVHRLRLGETVPGVLATGVEDRTARRCARALARFEDPELSLRGAGLPERVHLLPLLGLPEVTGRAITGRWRAEAERLRAPAVLGVSEQGRFEVDLDVDGPHALIAGTTGSGKSELLRTLVVSLAVANDPEHLTMVLIDYKGGGALDECAQLPHCVGLVTDLDEQLGGRALRCLQAELRHREHLLREVGLSHVRDYQRLRDRDRPGLEPMPRLVVVIDEFATLVKALPNFVDSLVGIAQLGRSLGMHLVMATQRPQGAVNEAIKNNVKLRIALRLESAGDSQDVIDNPSAATIGGRQWGRAFYRVSAKDVLPVQTALATGVSADEAAAAVRVRPFRFERGPAEPPAPAGRAEEGPTDLQRLVAATRDALALTGMPAPRQPWPEALPQIVRAEDLEPEAARGLQTEAASLATLAVADDPDRQSQYPVGWDPEAGNLLLYGVVGAGTTHALLTLALSLAARNAPDRLHLYAVDLGSGGLGALAELPHTGAVVGAGEQERLRRLVRMLRRELGSRKSQGAEGRPEWLVLIDNLGSLLADNDRGVAGIALIEDLERVYADGPAVGIRFAVSADRAGAVPGAWASLTSQKLVFRLADGGDYGLFGIQRASVPAFVPGRAVVAATGQVVQVAWQGEDPRRPAAAVARAWAGAAATAPAVRLLPDQVALDALASRAIVSRDPWWLPIGIGDAALEPVGLTLYEREHALIAGPARSGRSTALCTLARVALAADPGPAVVGYAPRRSPLREVAGLAALVTEHSRLEPTLTDLGNRPLLVLVDDAETVDDADGTIARLLARSGVHVVAAGRADGLRRAFGHWTQTVRDSRCGVLLQPDQDMDGVLLGATLPRLERGGALPGRGYISSDGMLDAVQVAAAAAVPSGAHRGA